MTLDVNQIDLVKFVLLNSPSTLLAAFMAWLLVRAHKEWAARAEERERAWGDKFDLRQQDWVQRQNQHADALIQFGERRAASEQKLVDSIERLARSVEEIEARIAQSSTCPVTSLTPEQVAAARAAGVSRDEAVKVIRETISRAVVNGGK